MRMPMCKTPEEAAAPSGVTCKSTIENGSRGKKTIYPFDEDALIRAIEWIRGRSLRAATDIQSQCGFLILLDEHFP
jgi:hypothetical protein